MSLGPKIREVRNSKKMTLKDVSEKTDLTSSYLSQVEREITEPSIAALRKISNALGVPLNVFLTEPDKANHLLIRSDERLKLVLPHSNVVYEFLTPIASEKKIPPKMEVLTMKLKPESWSSNQPFVHDTDECFIVISGSFDVVIEDERYSLEKGDSIYIREASPHRFYNSGEEEAVAVSIVAAPIY